MHPTDETTKPSRQFLQWKLITSLAALAVMFLWVSARQSNREPIYGGKTLTQWLQIYRPEPGTFWQPNDFYGHIHDELWYRLVECLKRSNEVSKVVEVFSSGGQSDGKPVTSEEVIALRQIGTNAIPHLIRLMAVKPTNWQKIRRAVAERLAFVPVAGGLLNRYWGSDPAEHCHIAAHDGFAVLGTNAGPALPALSNLLFTTRIDFPLASTVAGFGPKGIAVLTNGLTHFPPSRRNDAALALGLCGEAAKSAVPALVDCVERGDAGYDILGALGRIGCDDPRLVPALMRLAQNGSLTNGFCDEAMAVLLLGLQREKARVAAPLVIASYHAIANDPSEAAYRRFYRRILQAIAPDLETQLPPRPRDEDSDDWP